MIDLQNLIEGGVNKQRGGEGNTIRETRVRVVPWC